ncbi:MAG TPA: hypothetical protein VMI94_24790 [Bryobacteraceae bacterium]|nr:hypothetical protein [Bryobacteraceae bacterium]
MAQPRTLLFWLLLIPLLWWSTHAGGYLVHEYAHSFTAWAVGYKADPLALNYGHLTPGNVALLRDIDENVEYDPMFAARKGYLAGLVAVAGVLFGNGLLYFAARRLYSHAQRRHNEVLVLFALMLCLMNLGNFWCYVPVRTFATHADMATLEKGLHASPWWIVIVLGVPFAIAIWHFFTKLLPDACSFLFSGKRPPSAALLALSSFTVFVFFGAAGLRGYGETSRWISASSVCGFFPLVVILGWPYKAKHGTSGLVKRSPPNESHSVAV